MRKGKRILAVILSFALMFGSMSNVHLSSAAKKNKTAKKSTAAKKKDQKKNAKTKTKTTKKKAVKKDKTIQKLTVTNVHGKSLIIKKGKKFKIKTKIKRKKGSTASTDVVFKSSKKSVVSVSKKGVIKAKKLGKAKITVSSKANPSKKVVLTITVKTKVPRVKKITLNKKSLTLYIGGSEEDDEDWEDDEDFEEDGEEEDFDDDSDIEDDSEDDDEDFDEMEGDTDEFELIAKISPKAAAAAELSWKSSNSSVVEVDNDGYLLAMAAGTATITVMAKDGSKKKATCKVTVVDQSEEEEDDEDWDDEEFDDTEE